MGRRLPWYAAVRADRRAILTALGVALGVVFSIVGFVVPEGLRTETISQEGAFANQDTLVHRADLAPFDPALLGRPDATALLLLEAATTDGRPVWLVALAGPRAVDTVPGEVRPGAAHPAVELALAGGETFRVGAPVHSTAVAGGWFVLDASDAARLAPERVGKATYALVPSASADEVSRWTAGGFATTRAPAAEPFFLASAKEVADDLLLIVLFTSILVTIFVYEFLRSEIRERRREFGIWRSVGMRSRDLVVIVLGRALTIGAAGLVGGVLAAVALLGALRLATGSRLFALDLGTAQLMLVASAFLGAALLGGLVPAWSASREHVARQLEAPA